MTQGRFDGLSIETYDGKLSGAFDIDEILGEKMVFGDTVTFLVTGQMGGTNFNTTKLGDIKRTNVFHVSSADYVDPDTAIRFYGDLGLASQPTLLDNTDEVDELVE